jgi:hypothetical protein
MEWKPTYKPEPPKVNIKTNNARKMGVLNHQDNPPKFNILDETSRKTKTWVKPK